MANKMENESKHRKASCFISVKHCVDDLVHKYETHNHKQKNTNHKKKHNNFLFIAGSFFVNILSKPIIDKIHIGTA